jgi:SAM-dependent methyltransferase
VAKNFSQQTATTLIQELRQHLTAHKAASEKLIAALEGPLSADQITAITEQSCQLARSFSAQVHSSKMFHDWSVPPSPEWMDHFIDQHFQTRHRQVTFWMERGVYGVLALKPGGRFLELCCGDGYNTFHFYSPFADNIIACDFDPSALAHARAHNQAANVTFVEADIRTSMPQGRFDNVLWDAAIEHFTEEQIAAIMSGIKDRLGGQGVLSGYTLVEKADGKYLHQHEREFRSMADLADFLKPWFSTVRVFETIHPARHNLYFWASDNASAVPFDETWQHGLSIRP